MQELLRLRLIFVIYFIVVISVYVILGRDISETSLFFSPGFFFILTIFMYSLLFIIGLMLFSSLLNRRNWARVTLLVLGWLALINFILSTAIMSISSSGNMGNLFILDQVIDFLGALFWGYTVYLLQFKKSVRDIFIDYPEVVENSSLRH
jgi:hypothetical protein